MRNDIIYGRNAIGETIKAGRRKIHRLLYAGERPLWPVTLQKTDVKELNSLVEGSVHQNLVAFVDPFPEMYFSDFVAGSVEEKLVLALDCIQDPQNFGTLCRSALCFGVKSVLVPQDRSVQVSAAVCKASAGAVEHLNIVRVTNLVRALTELKEKKFWVYGASLAAKAQNLTEIEPAEKSVIVLGSEGKGLRTLVEASCDVLVKIPQAPGFNSLNVAQAGSIILYDFFRRNVFPSPLEGEGGRRTNGPRPGEGGS